MLELEVNLIITEWGSKHSGRVFKDWHSISIPKPAKTYLPEWHKNTMPLNENGDRTIKKCMPVTDVLTTGYILPAPVDMLIYIDDDNNVKFNCSNGEFFVSRHSPTQYANTPYSINPVLKFDFPWVFKTPPGWSMLYTQPFHRDNSKLEALSAIVETDTYYNSVNCPVQIKNWKPNEVLEIPKGYPLVQAVPVKRDEWKMTTQHIDWNAHFKTTIELVKNSSAYRDEFRQKKKFN